MRCALAGLLILLLGTLAGAESPPPVSDRPAPAVSEVVRTLALLDRIDPRSLPADQRQSLYFALADALLGDGQPERALGFLAKTRQNFSPDTAAGVDEKIRSRLQGVASSVLATALQGETPLASLLQAELARRGAALPVPLAKVPAVGVLLPLSGRYAPFGREVQQGLELARATLATEPTAGFVYRDTAAEGIVMARLVAELAVQPELLVVIGPLLSNDAAPASTQAEGERLPLLLLAPREGTTGSHVFRNALTLAAQSRALADFAQSERLQRFIILHPATRQGELSAELFRAAVAGRGGQVLASQSYPPDTVDLRQQLQALADAARRAGSGPPEALFLPDDAQPVAQIIPQLAFAKLDQLQLLGPGAWNDPELGRMAGPLSEGAVFVDGFFAGSPWPEVRDFVARYQAAYGVPPSILAAQGYDAARIILTLLARPEVRDRAALRQALANLRDFPGVTGQTRFGPNGEAEKVLFLLQVQDGAVVQIN
jgi:ABC-type branched-subunit amino acid transport system substrate-binding protein